MPTLTSTSLGQFCREVAIQLSPIDVLLEEWELTPTQFQELQQSAGYKHEIAIIANEMAELGADAGYVYRMKALSEIFIKDIVNLMNDTETPRSTRVELIKFCAEMARVKAPPPLPASQQQSFNQGPSVVFHFGAGLPVQTMKVIPEAIEVQEAHALTATRIRKGFGLELE